jgi:hypothetical protein
VILSIDGVVATPDEFGERIDVDRLAEELRLSSDPKPGVVRERLAT